MSDKRLKKQLDYKEKLMKRQSERGLRRKKLLELPKKQLRLLKESDRKLRKLLDCKEKLRRMQQESVQKLKKRSALDLKPKQMLNVKDWRPKRLKE